jgi:serine protease
MLETGMDRFLLHFTPPLAAWRPVCVLLGLTAGLMASASAREVPTQSLLVQLRPEAVAPTAPEPGVRVAAPTPQARREQAQAAWQRRHEAHVAHLDTVARAAGVPLAGRGTAGSALRVDLAAGAGPADLAAAARRLRLHPDVLSVSPNVRVQRAQAAPVVPNDPLFAQQWHLQAPLTQASAINLPPAWARSTGAAAPVTVAVVDTGVRFDHPDLAGHLLAGYDFVSEVDYANDGNGRDADASDPGDWVTSAESRTALFAGCDVSDSSWHGTAIAGIVGAASNNGAGVSGVHWGARVLPVRVAGKCGALLSDLLDGVRWAAGLPVAGAPANANPARIINLSYGGSGACDSAYQTTVNDALAAGALLVVAAGNAGEPVTRPADCSGVLAVTAVRGDGAKTDYGSYGPNVGLAAPGGSGTVGVDAGLLTTVDSGRRGPVSAAYATLVGTSFSAPLAAGVAGLVLGVQPGLTPAGLAALLRGAVRPHTQGAVLAACSPQASSQGVCNCTTQTCGAGLLDADLALAAAQATGTGSGAGSTGTSPAPTDPAAAPVAEPEAQGGGGAWGWGWGLALWAWVLAGLRGRRRAAQGQA